MPTYIALVNWTDQEGIRTVSAAVERADKGSEIASKHGARFLEHYWTVGPYDVVAIVEAPDDESAPLSSGRSARRGTLSLRSFARSTTRRCRGSWIGLDLHQGHERGVVLEGPGLLYCGLLPLFTELPRRLVFSETRRSRESIAQ